MMVTGSVHEGGEDWITAFAALEMLIPHHGGLVPTKELLAEMLKDGRIKAHAARVWDSDIANENSAWASRASAEVQENVEVEPAVWRSSRYWNADLPRWRWNENRFYVTASKKPMHRTFLEEVRFSRSQVENLLPSKDRKNIGGRNIRATDWEKIGVALIEMAHMGVFSKPGEHRQIVGKPYANLAEFISKIDVMTTQTYKESHAFAILGPIYKHFHPEVPEPSQGLGPQTEDDS